jgi:hypothetical protein
MIYTEARELRCVDQHLLLMLSSPAYFQFLCLLFLYKLVCSRFLETNIFWNADVGQIGLEGNTEVGRMANSSNAFIPKIHGTTSVASV